MTVDWELFGTEVLRIVVALVLGGSIGLERELRERAAGFRTHILVAVGASAFTLASIYGFQLTAEQAAEGQTYDPSRVAAQIVSGIGFLGAGAIIRHGISVRGLTTAASLWAVAAIGMLSGAGMYGLATATTLLVLVSLAGLRFLEHHIAGTRGQGRVDLHVRFTQEKYGNLSRLIGDLDERHVSVLRLSSDPEDADRRVVHLNLQLPESLGRNELMSIISQDPDTVEVSAD